MGRRGLVGQGRCKPVEIAGTVYPSIAAASRALGIRHNTIIYRLSRGYTGERLTVKRLKRNREH